MWNDEVSRPRSQRGSNRLGPGCGTSEPGLSNEQQGPTLGSVMVSLWSLHLCVKLAGPVSRRNLRNRGAKLPPPLLTAPAACGSPGAIPAQNPRRESVCGGSASLGVRHPQEATVVL